MSYLPVAVVILAVTGICTSGPAVVPRIALTGPVVIPIQQLSPKPYEFGYEFADGLGMTQHRREFADGTGSVKGSYGYIDPFGVNRLVEYTADGDGYKAVVRSNEPGTASQNVGDAIYFVQPPPAAAVAQGLRQFVVPKAIL